MGKPFLYFYIVKKSINSYNGDYGFKSKKEEHCHSVDFGLLDHSEHVSDCLRCVLGFVV